MERITIWRLTWSHTIGVYWQAQRQCYADDADAWLAIFRKDEPGVTYTAAKKAPKIMEGDREGARHSAM